MAECNHRHPLHHDGTSQDQRFLEALEPDSVRIHDFSLRDWMKFAWHFAARLNYFDINDDQNPAGNWQAFMKSESEVEAFLKDASLVEQENWIPEEEREKIKARPLRGDYEPHLALFLSFLKLLGFAREQLNGFTRRHLDFYYGRVLNLSRQSAVPDRVFVLFELAKNAAGEIVEKGALLDAGRDLQGRPLQYATLEEITVNQAKVSALKSIFHQEGISLRNAEKTDSADGKGKEFSEQDQSWQPFGDEAWTPATVGFALASPVLLMKEGTRSISVTLTLENPEGGSLPSQALLNKHLKGSLTGEKGWLDVPLEATPDKNTLLLEIAVSPALAAIVPYDQALHTGKYQTEEPVLRFLIDTSVPGGYGVYDALRKFVIRKADIQVSVNGAKDLVMENDHGKLDPSKPFYPFGTTAGAGSRLYIGSAEVFQKKWESVTLHLSWKDKPQDLSGHYACYLSKYIDTYDSNYNVTGNEAVSARKVQSDDYFTVKVRYLQNNRWYPSPDEADSQELFTDPLVLKPDEADTEEEEPGRKDRYKSRKKDRDAGQTAGFNPSTRSDYLQLTLEQSFLYEHYARLYSMAMVAKADHPELILPRQPYIPVISSLTLDYTASESNDFEQKNRKTQEKLENYTRSSVSLFHEEPFGQSEQHVFLKERCDFLHPEEQRNIRLIPGYSAEGEFFIGLDQAEPYDMLNLLFQMSEGSENPLAVPFGPNKKIEWSVLAGNEWKPLGNTWLLADGTGNLLRSGIIRILIPPGIKPSNTVFREDLVWLRASLPEGPDHSSVCRLITVQAQAVEAVFAGQENELSARTGNLPAGSIKGMADKPGLIKKITQPFASFGGTTAESDHAFYLRVSERLRHRHRAVNIWDYERLVLQEFPSVYKVKCISHTTTVNEAGNPDYSELSPGDVSLVVIPDIRGKNSYDPLKPRASQDLLHQINVFLVPLNSLHVRTHATNPDYEMVWLDFRVKFYDQFDPNTYRKVLNEDLIRYLSPWAFGEFSGIHFGGTLYKSVVIRFIETRPYVDFISQVRMVHRLDENDQNTNDQQVISASFANTILVSAPEHQIQLIDKERICHE